MSEQLKYLPLEPKKREIRILTVLPLETPVEAPGVPLQPDHDTIVRCTLRKESLNDGPSYRALSYVWGGPKITKEILVDDCIFHATTNLEQALRHIRQTQQPECLWVDAVCINQKNNDEKRDQVELMGTIYKEANLILVWLGESANESDSLMDTLDRIGNEAIEAGVLELRPDELARLVGPEVLEEPLISLKKPVVALAGKIASDFPYLAFNTLTQRTYWQRVWTVQEIALGKDVTFMCGSKKLSFSQFAACVIQIGLTITTVIQNLTEADFQSPSLMLKEICGSRSARMPSIGVRRRHHYKTGTPETLVELLGRTCVVEPMKATKPCDKIYGLLGLASDADELGIRPHYDRDFHQVYRDVARILIERGNTDILSWCQECKSPLLKPESQWQSWVPDFSSTIREPIAESQGKGLFSASAKHPLSLLPIGDDGDANILTIAGAQFDTIRDIGTNWATASSDQSYYDVAGTYLNEIEIFCKQAHELPSTTAKDDINWSEAVWRISCADLEYVDYGRRRAHTAVADGYLDLKERVASPETRSRMQSDILSRYIISTTYLHNKKPFLSKQGFVGLVPAHSQPDDVICIIFGSIVPFVLRQLPEGEYKLIGEAYVHGIMDGEFMKTNPTTEVFHLR